MVVWSRFSNISFNELAAAEGQQLGLNAHLQALGATGLLRALEQCMGKYYDELPSGQGRHRKRRRVNEDLNQLSNAMDHIDAPESNALGQSAAPMQPLASTAVDRMSSLISIGRAWMSPTLSMLASATSRPLSPWACQSQTPA